MKVLLSTITPTKEEYIQLGVYTLNAYLRKFLPYKNIAVNVEVIRPKRFISYQTGNIADFNNNELEKIKSKLLQHNPNIIGFSCYIWNIDIILKIAKLVKKDKPNVTIILGGPEVSESYAKIIIKDYIDFIIKYDGEESLLHLLKAIVENEDVSKIKGICYRSKNKIIDNPNQSVDLEKIPSPYYEELIKLNNPNIRTTIETTRGCPFKCGYCTYSLSHPKVQYFPLNKVYEEIKFILKKSVIKMGITDDNFNINEQRAKKILKQIIKYNRNTLIVLFINAYALRLSEEFVDLLKKANVWAEIGVQTVNKDTLKISKRFSGFELLESNLKLLEKKKVNYNLHFIIGLPGDTYTDIKRSIDWAYSVYPNSIFLYPLLVFPGTFFYNHAEKLGIKFFKSLPYRIKQTNTYPKKDIDRSIQLAYTVTLFKEKKFLKKTVKELVHKYDLSFSEICEKWMDYCKLIYKEKEFVYQLSKNFILKIFEKKEIKPDLSKLDELIKEDTEFYFNYSLSDLINEKGF